MTTNMDLFAEFAFEAAHRLPKVPPEHPCARLHGHSYQIRLTLTGPIDEDMGWVTDFGAITAAFEPLRTFLDHHLLNEIPGLENPTSETLARWLWDRLITPLPWLTAIEVRETRSMGCVYRGHR
jgi:6-pyruvoyltetrahydropterin/6-carboxytetrahydropterin synthase